MAEHPAGPVATDAAAAVDDIGEAVGLRRDGPIRYDTYRTEHGAAEPRLVWVYRPATADDTAAAAAR